MTVMTHPMKDRSQSDSCCPKESADGDVKDQSTHYISEGKQRTDPGPQLSQEQHCIF